MPCWWGWVLSLNGFGFVGCGVWIWFLGLVWFGLVLLWFSLVLWLLVLRVLGLVVFGLSVFCVLFGLMWCRF